MAGYIGVGGKARKVTAMYVGVDGTEHRVKKAYVGDENGKARLWWEQQKISFKIRFRYSGTVEDMSFEAYAGMSMIEWVNSDFPLLDGWDYHITQEPRPGEPGSGLLRYSGQNGEGRVLMICDGSFRFLECYNGATFDTSFNVLTMPVTIYVDVWDYTNGIQPALPNYPIHTMSGVDFWTEAIDSDDDLKVTTIAFGSLDNDTSDTLKLECESTGARKWITILPVGSDKRFYVPAKDRVRYSMEYTTGSGSITETILFTVQFNGERAGEETPYVRYQAIAIPEMTVAEWAKSDMVSEARVLGFTVAVQDGADAGKVKLQVTVTGTGEQFSVTCDETLVLRDGAVYDLENGFSEVDDT